MQIAKSKKVEDVGHMEEKILEMSRDFSEMRDREQIMISELQAENTWPRR